MSDTTLYKQGYKIGYELKGKEEFVKSNIMRATGSYADPRITRKFLIKACVMSNNQIPDILAHDDKYIVDNYLDVQMFMFGINNGLWCKEFDNNMNLDK